MNISIPFANIRPTRRSRRRRVCRFAMLAQDATEASRMAHAGRSLESLKESRTFDEDRVERLPLFAPVKRQGGLF